VIYVADITTPISYGADNPLKTILKISKGLIYRIEVEFPTGPCGLLYTCAYDGLHPVWPSTDNAWYHSDGVTIAFDDLYLKSQPPYELQIYSYNLDDTYEHWCQWRIGMVTEELFIARFLPTYEYKYFQKMIERMEAEQRQRAEETIKAPFSWLVQE